MFIEAEKVEKLFSPPFVIKTKLNQLGICSKIENKPDSTYISFYIFLVFGTLGSISKPQRLCNYQKYNKVEVNPKLSSFFAHKLISAIFKVEK